MPPRKQAETRRPVLSPPKPDRPLAKLTSFSQFAPSAGPSKRSSATSTNRMPAGRVKRKIEVVELDSEVEEILSSDEDASASSRPGVAAAKLKDLKGKGRAKEPVKPSRGQKGEKRAGERSQAELWTDLYAPQSTGDLALNKKKVDEVRSWLSEALPASGTSSVPSQASTISKYRRILCLTGPAGVGKTACIKAVSKEIDCELVEWAEGFDEWGMGSGDAGRESVIARLEGFLLRSSFPSLGVFGSPSTPSSASAFKRKMLLLDALPNLSNQDTRRAFQTLLRQFAQPSGGAPLVLVVSDSGETGRASEGWGERGKDGGWGWRDVLGKEVMALPGVRIVNFNPVAPTFLTKALHRILPLAVPSAPLRPPKDAIQLIVHSSQGDVRSAVNALQFLCRAQVKLGKGGASAGTKKATGKGSRGGKPPRGADKALKSLVDTVTRREQSLMLFHALGKVLWNKRLGDPTLTVGEEAEFPPQPPKQIPLPVHHEDFRRRLSKVDVEVLFKEAPVDTGLYNLYLHQNYPVFCTDIEECAEACETLSRSDALKTDDDMWQSSPIAIAYAFNTSVRGLLMALPSPMPHHGQKVYKPDWFAAYREQRENETAVDEIGRWAATAGVGLGMGGGGQISRAALTTQIIPQLRYLSIPPSYPASLPPLTVLDYASSSTSRCALNLQTILNVDDPALNADEDETPDGDLSQSAAASGSVELLEGGVERKSGGLSVMFTAREEVDGGVAGEDSDDFQADEIEGDEIGDFSD